MKYPTKTVKYSGTLKVWPGESMLYQQDGSVITFKEVFAGFATGKNSGTTPKEVEFYTPEDN